MTLILSGTNGVSDIDGDASTPALRGTDANSGVFFGADQVGVATNGVERVEFGNSETVFNDGGASVDFRVEGDTNANLLFVDASADKVGIGTSSPSVELDVSGTLAVRNASTSYINTYCSGGGNRDYQIGVNGSAFVFNDITSGTSERMRIDTSGNLLVACTDSNETTSVGVRLINNGGIRSTRSESTSAASTLDVYSTGASAYRFYVNMAGTVFATNTSISGISDIRYKENVRDLDAGLNEVMQLRPRKFDWKEGKGQDTKDCRGFIAQEFEQVFPDLIDEWKDPAPEGEEPYKSVRQDLIPVLVKAIQELKAELDEAKARIAALETGV